VDGAQGPAGPSVASADAGNIIRLGGDGLLFVPDSYLAKNISLLPLLP
jgi:quinolinate synthase